MSSDAVLLTCHGTVSDPADIPAFLLAIRRGRPPPPELCEEVARRYRVIGGSPLMEQSRAQASALEARLGMPVRVAARLWHPYPAEVLAQLAREGVTRVLSLPLAPQSVEVYHAPVREAGVAAGLRVVCAPGYGTDPRVVDAFAATVEDAIARAAASWGGAEPQATPIVLSAHSLPSRVIAAGDRYEVEFRAMAAAVGARFIERGHPVEIAFQSQGASAEAWLGPDLQAVFGALAKRGLQQVIVAPIGFVAEHVETLYDLDVEAIATASNAGLPRFARASAVRDGAPFMDALEDVARRAFAAATASATAG